MSATSVSDVNDRLSALELRVQQQEDELTVMKAALADVLRRLAASEDSGANRKQHGAKGKAPPPVAMDTRCKARSPATLPPAGGAAMREASSLSCIANGGTPGRKRDSASVTRKETVSSAAKR